jgi:UDP-4-amino-4-deoxy-L-arabinose-oxoglutarate aminotransferase
VIRLLYYLTLVKGILPLNALEKRKDFLPVCRPALGEDEVNAVVECLRSGWITSGPRAQEFEESFSKAVKAPYAVAVSSGTAGLHLVLHALGIGDGDEVITSPMTFASTVNMIALTGARPVFVDINYEDLMLRPGLIRERLTKKTRAIIPVHIAGASCDINPIEEIADDRGLLVIEDAAHALGTVYNGEPVGSHPHTSIFSFQAIKNLTTAEGGMITCHDKDLADRVRRLRFHGIERLAWERYSKGGKPHYDIHAPGFKYNLPDILAAMGLVQLNKLEEINDKRRNLAKAYHECLKGLSGLDLPPEPGRDKGHGWHLFIVKVKAIDRDEFMSRLQEYNIGTGLHFPACHLLSYVRERYGYKRGDFPECERAADRIVSLPLFPDMTTDDVLYVCAAIRKILKE